MSQVPEREIIKRAILGDTVEAFEIFREYYLGYKSYKAQKRWYQMVLDYDRCLTLCPGESGKSMEAVDVVTHLIVKNRFVDVYGAKPGELNCVFLSLSADLGRKWIAQIQAYLESPKIVEDFGTFRNPKRWSADSILVLSPQNKQARVDHPTVQALGIGGQVFGLRAHFLVADDIVDKENSGTSEARKKLWETFQEGPAAWLRPGGRIWIIGTRMNSKDFYQQTMDAGVYKYIVDKAVDFETGKVLCPEKKGYNLAYFKRKKKEMGTASFNRRFMNVAIDEADNPFKAEFFPALYEDRRPFGLVQKGWRVYIGVDPAVGRGRGRSNIGLCAIAYDAKEPSKRYLIDYVTEQMSPERQADTILRWYSEYRAHLVVIEKNACQLYLKSLIKERSHRYGINPRIIMSFTGVNKWDIEYGVDMVAAAFENGNFRIPYADAAKEKAHRFRDMLLESPPDKPIDIVMSMWFVEQQLVKLIKRKVKRIELDKQDYLQLVRAG